MTPHAPFINGKEQLSDILSISSVSVRLFVSLSSICFSCFQIVGLPAWHSKDSGVRIGVCMAWWQGLVWVGGVEYLEKREEKEIENKLSAGVFPLFGMEALLSLGRLVWLGLLVVGREIARRAVETRVSSEFDSKYNSYSSFFLL
jgi:hypothetical protein